MTVNEYVKAHGVSHNEIHRDVPQRSLTGAEWAEWKAVLEKQEQANSAAGGTCFTWNWQHTMPVDLLLAYVKWTCPVASWRVSI